MSTREPGRGISNVFRYQTQEGKWERERMSEGREGNKDGAGGGVEGILSQEMMER